MDRRGGKAGMREVKFAVCAVLLYGSLTHAAPPAGARSTRPDLGPNVMIFDASMPAADIQWILS